MSGCIDYVRAEVDFDLKGSNFGAKVDSNIFVQETGLLACSKNTFLVWPNDAEVFALHLKGLSVNLVFCICEFLSKIHVV